MKSFIWVDSPDITDYGSMLFIDNEPIAAVYESDGYFYGNCYIFDDIYDVILGAHNLEYAKNEMLNKIRKCTLTKINEYKELKYKLREVR